MKELFKGVLAAALIETVLFPGITLIAQTSEAIGKPPDPCATSTYPVPVIFYTPETELGVGLGLPSSRPDQKDCLKRKPSLLVPALVYTQRQQIIARVFAKQYVDEGNYFIDLATAYNRYPDKFYGIGDQTILDDEELFSENYAAAQADFYRRVGEDSYIGPALIREEYEIADTIGDGSLAHQVPEGSDSGSVAGYGVRYLFNSRDNEFQPRNGTIVEFGTLAFDRGFGSDFTYRSYHLRGRKYLPLAPGRLVAMDGLIDANDGNPPFRKLAQLGGQYLVRGFFLGRYRDKCLGAAQLEYRHDLTERWSVVGFFASGKVKPSLAQLPHGRAITSKGVGVRYVLDSGSRINLRLDLATGGDSSGVYFGAGEAF